MERRNHERREARPSTRPGDILVSWLGHRAEIVVVTVDEDGDVVCGLRPSNEACLGPYDRIARFDGDELVNVLSPD